MSDKRQIVTNLRVVAALAEKTANDVEGNRLWEGERDQALSQISKALSDIPGERTNR